MPAQDTKEYNRQYYQANREREKARSRARRQETRRIASANFAEYMQGKACVDCGEGDLMVLELDHVSGEKRQGISEMITHGYAWATIQEELTKCVIRCCNCYRIRTASQFGWLLSDLSAVVEAELTPSQRCRYRNTVRLVEYLKDHPCIDCGKQDPLVLEFDHVTGDKLNAISNLRGRKWGIIERELTKCVVRCSNCHRRKTVSQLDWRKEGLV